MSMIWSLAQAIWVGFGTVRAAPLTWEEADEKMRDGYYTAMCAGFFELRLCDSNWKAEKVATNMYHLWLLSWKLQIRPPALDGKHIHDASMSAGPSKKLRVAGAVSTNILFADHTAMLRVLPRWTAFPTKRIQARGLHPRNTKNSRRRKCIKGIKNSCLTQFQWFPLWWQSATSKFKCWCSNCFTCTTVVVMKLNSKFVFKIHPMWVGQWTILLHSLAK